MENDRIVKPPEMEYAFSLLYLCIGLGILQTVVGMLMSATAFDVQQVYEVLSAVLIPGALYTIVYLLRSGHRWIRVVFVMLVVTNLLLFSSDVTSFTGAPFTAVVRGATVVIHVVVVILLFSHPATEWLRAVKASKQSQG